MKKIVMLAMLGALSLAPVRQAAALEETDLTNTLEILGFVSGVYGEMNVPTQVSEEMLEYFAISQIGEYRGLSNLVKAIQNGKEIGRAEIEGYPYNLVSATLEKLEARAWLGFGERKISSNIMRDIDWYLYRKAREEYDGFDVYVAQDKSSRYRQTLNKLLDLLEIRYRHFKKVLDAKLDHSPETRSRLNSLL